MSVTPFPKDPQTARAQKGEEAMTSKTINLDKPNLNFAKRKAWAAESEAFDKQVGQGKRPADKKQSPIKKGKK